MAGGDRLPDPAPDVYLDEPVAQNTKRPLEELDVMPPKPEQLARVPAMFVQARPGDARGSTMGRYLHAWRTSYPDAAELTEARLFGSGLESWVESRRL